VLWRLETTDEYAKLEDDVVTHGIVVGEDVRNALGALAGVQPTTARAKGQVHPFKHRKTG
jgi:hypothetical protein